TMSTTHSTANTGSGKEGESVTLSCKYSTNSNNVYLYWYRQNSNQAPQYLLYKGAGSYSSAEHSTNKRFKCTTSRDSTQLTIEALTMSDTAIYYCALMLYKNSFAQNFLSATMKCSFLPTVWDQFHSSRASEVTVVTAVNMTVWTRCSYLSISTVIFFNSSNSNYLTHREEDATTTAAIIIIPK
uniref:Ig-like domain-containing protein n=1 Tax=Scleropages formosus TaxID=113540 RepID=A0A8C9VN05_SCLFO